MLRQLALFWFFATGALGIYFPYFTLYLEQNVGLSGSQVGLVYATLPLVGSVAQPLWGQLADRRGSRTQILALLTLGSAFGYAGLSLPGGFASMLAATLLMAVFSTALLPMSVSVSMAALGRDARFRYGSVRVWGTVGYLISVVATPPLLHLAQARLHLHADAPGIREPGLGGAFVVAGALMGVAAIIAARLPRDGEVGLRARKGELSLLLANPTYLRVLVFTFGSFLFLHAPMVLFPMFLRTRGGDMDTLSRMWVLMLLFEIPLVMHTGRLVQRWGPRRVLSAATAAGGLRWLLCALNQELWVVYLAQLLHAAVVAGMLVATPMLVEVLVPRRLRSSGQAGLTLFGSSLAGSLSSVLGGFLSEAAGIDAVYWVGGGGALCLAVAAPLLLPRTEAPRTAEALS